MLLLFTMTKVQLQKTTGFKIKQVRLNQILLGLFIFNNMYVFCLFLIKMTEYVRKKIVLAFFFACVPAFFLKYNSGLSVVVLQFTFHDRCIQIFFHMGFYAGFIQWPYRLKVHPQC